jgi:hypothetical protein
MWARKHGGNVSQENYFSVAPLTADEYIVIARLDNNPSDNEFDRLLKTLVDDGCSTAPFNLIVPDREKIRRGFDISTEEMNFDMEKAVALRIASKDCM